MTTPTLAGAGRILLHGLPVLALTACALAGTAAESWSDGERHGRWRVVFAGHGSVTGDDHRVLLEPATATSDARTHAALVVTDDQHGREVEVAVTVATERQLRPGVPNPWEVGWVLWSYTDPEHFYAVALKPNGWEVSKQDPAYPGNQRFLATGDEPVFPVGRSYRVGVTASSGTAVVTVDGQVLTQIADTERPYTGGAVGLYTEDARVRFSQLTVNDPGVPPSAPTGRKS